MTSADDTEPAGGGSGSTDDTGAGATDRAETTVGGGGGGGGGKTRQNATVLDEPFVTYHNSMYRFVSMGGAAMVAILGITGLVIGWTLDPAPPPQFFFIDGILTVVLFGWYLLGLRCRLDLGRTQVHIGSKYGDFRIDRSAVRWVDADRSLWGALQWSGRPLLIRYRVPDGDGTEKTRRAFGCLPNDAQGQERILTELQQALGAPDEPGGTRPGDGLAERLAAGDTSGDVSGDDHADLEAAVAARLAEMEPEGDDTSDVTTPK